MSAPGDLPEGGHGGPPPFPRWRGFAVLAVVGLLATAPASPTTFETPIGSLEYLGEVRVETGLRVAGEEVGGLSALVYDPQARVYHALSDDPAEHGPARWFTFSLDLAAGKLTAESLAWKGVTRLTDLGGGAFAAKTVDPEGLALDDAGGFLVSSEGQVEAGVAPFLRRYDAAGHALSSFELPLEMLPGVGRGIRHNRGGEGLARTPDGRTLWLALEGPLSQDGPDPTPTAGALARIYRFELASGRLEGSFLIPLEPVHAAAVPAGGLEVSGISEVLAFDADTLLILERSFARGVGHGIRLVQVDLRGADDVARIPSLAALEPQARAALHPATRTPVLDLARLDLERGLDNLEGLAFGPTLPDGRRSLVLVSDNNFSGDQFTQVLAFALGPAAANPSH